LSIPDEGAIFREVNMALSQLDAVNDMLGLMGELPVNDLENVHPLVPTAVRALRTASDEIQVRRWWFNTEAVTLTPQIETKQILLPHDTLAADPFEGRPRTAVRGNRLYNLDTQSVEWDKSVTVRLHRMLPFDELPVLARMVISYKAQLAFGLQYDADPMKLSAIREALADARANLGAEDIRSTRSNLLYKPSTLRVLTDISGNRDRRNMR
jgi:hypothetical protein